MTDFYIRKIAFSGPGVQRKEYNFKRGINIIYGDSDKGKSYVAECFDFMFGAKSIRLNASSGYNTVRMYVETSQGEIFLERRLDSKKDSVQIDSSDERYRGLCGNGLGPAELENFWLRFLGINEHQTVVISSFYKHERLTWNNIKKLFLLKEDDISKKGSVINTQMKCRSTLLFLLTGEAYESEPTRESDADRQNRSRAAIELMAKIRKHYQERQQELLEKLNNVPVEQIHRKWSDLMDRFHEEEEKLKDAVRRSQLLHLKLDEARKFLASVRMQHENYALLRSLYDARIKRQSFTAEGQLITVAQDQAPVCPFCGTAHPEQAINAEVLNASVAEMHKTEKKIQHLQEANRDLDTTIQKQESLVKKLEKECEELDHLISSSYAPMVKDMKSQLQEYTELIKLKKELDVISVEYNTIETKFGTVNDSPVPEYDKFRPRDKYPDAFFADMSNALRDMLLECGLEDVHSVGFDKGTFDLYVHWQDKKTYGEGFRALYNSSVAFCLFRLLCEKGVYKPGLLILDSPTKALKISIGEQWIKGFYQYLIRESGCGQAFVIDNALPEGLELENAVVYDLQEGLLPDYRRPAKQRKTDSEETNVIPGQIELEGRPE